MLKFVLSVLAVLCCGDCHVPTSSLEQNITTIYLISSCHLDVGFADTSANIVNEYFDKHFPNAIKYAKELREIGKEERLVFTTHSFLVYLYYNCLPELGLHCPTESQRLEFTNAVHEGDITWHAFPFNSEMEFYDISLADFGFKLSHKLDAQFGKKPSITMSQRDVPGTTRSIIPILTANGVEAITVGVNYAAMPPAVPTAFVWKDPVSGTDVIGMWHPHGYGGEHGLSLQNMVIVPGLQSALAFAIRGDNSGPPSLVEVTRNYLELKVIFPNAKIIASGYDVFVNELLSVKQQLPVYTEEIGDTWIYGIASDPGKTAANRAIMRLRSDCIESGDCSLDDDNFFAFSALLLKNGEHTWGKDVKTFLHDLTNWTNDKFQSKLNASNFQDMVNSWIEQRFWGVDYATQLLGDHPLHNQITKVIESLKFDGKISTAGYVQQNLDDIVECGDIVLHFSSDSGGIDYFEDKRVQPSKVYATKDHLLAQVVYQTFTGEDYLTFFSEYIYDFLDIFAYLDFGKPGLNGTKKMKISPIPIELWLKRDIETCNLILVSKFDSTVVNEYGGSELVHMHISLVNIASLNAPLKLNFTLYVTNKTATRIPEALSLYFNPAGVNSSSMTISKLGEYISVLDVLRNGSKHVHCSDNGVKYHSTADQLQERDMEIQAIDTGLIMVGYPNPFPTPMEQPNVEEGFAFNIVNNIWGTNYVMWYPFLVEDTSTFYRFVMSV